MTSLVKYLAVSSVLALALVACGGGDEDSASSADIGNAAGSSAKCNDTTYKDTMGYSARRNKYSGDGQCLPLIQAAESYRQQAIANCQAGDITSATTIYTNYYAKSVTQVNGFCP